MAVQALIVLVSTLPTTLQVYTYPEPARTVAIAMVNMRHAMLPYITGLQRTYQTNGVPIMRPLVFDFPDDVQTRSLSMVDSEYMFGPRFLVAPIFTNCSATTSCMWRDVYLPKLPNSDSWTHVFTNISYVGGRVHNVSGPIDTFPLFSRTTV